MIRADVLIIGGGLAGMSVAVETTAAGMSTIVLDSREAGAASAAAGGLIAPTLGTRPSPGVAAAFLEAARAFPRYLDRLQALASDARPVDCAWGVLGVATSDAEMAAISRDVPEGGEVLDVRALAELEPGLRNVAGAVTHPDDGWTNPADLTAAMGRAAGAGGRLAVHRAQARSVRRGAPDARVVECEGGLRFEATRVVVAAGAWTPLVDVPGISVPVEPVRGQMLSYEGRHGLRHAIELASGYMVPRGDTVVVGSTTERVGFVPVTTPEAIQGFRDWAERVVPALAQPSIRRRAWAGLRPMTPDGMPVVAPVADDDRVIVVAGHGKNGVLLAATTAALALRLLTRGD